MESSMNNFLQDPYLFLQNNIINSLALDVRHQENIKTNNAYILKKSQNIYSLLHTESTTREAVEAYTLKNNNNSLEQLNIFYIDIPKVNPIYNVLFLPPLTGGSIIVIEKDYENYRIFFDERKYASIFYENVLAAIDLYEYEETFQFHPIAFACLIYKNTFWNLYLQPQNIINRQLVPAKKQVRKKDLGYYNQKMVVSMLERKREYLKDKIRYFSQENNLQLEETAQFPTNPNLNEILVFDNICTRLEKYLNEKYHTYSLYKNNAAKYLQQFLALSSASEINEQLLVYINKNETAAKIAPQNMFSPLYLKIEQNNCNLESIVTEETTVTTNANISLQKSKLLQFNDQTALTEFVSQTKYYTADKIQLKKIDLHSNSIIDNFDNLKKEMESKNLSCFFYNYSEAQPLFITQPHIQLKQIFWLFYFLLENKNSDKDKILLNIENFINNLTISNDKKSTDCEIFIKDILYKDKFEYIFELYNKKVFNNLTEAAKEIDAVINNCFLIESKFINILIGNINKDNNLYFSFSPAFSFTLYEDINDLKYFITNIIETYNLNELSDIHNISISTVKENDELFDLFNKCKIKNKTLPVEILFEPNFTNNFQELLQELHLQNIYTNISKTNSILNSSPIDSTYFALQALIIEHESQQIAKNLDNSFKNLITENAVGSNWIPLISSIKEETFDPQTAIQTYSITLLNKKDLITTKLLVTNDPLFYYAKNVLDIQINEAKPYLYLNESDKPQTRRWGGFKPLGEIANSLGLSVLFLNGVAEGLEGEDGEENQPELSIAMQFHYFVGLSQTSQFGLDTINSLASIIKFNKNTLNYVMKSLATFKTFGLQVIDSALSSFSVVLGAIKLHFAQGDTKIIFSVQLAMDSVGLVISFATLGALILGFSTIAGILAGIGIIFGILSIFIIGLIRGHFVNLKKAQQIGDYFNKLADLYVKGGLEYKSQEAAIIPLPDVIIKEINLQKGTITFGTQHIYRHGKSTSHPFLQMRPLMAPHLLEQSPIKINYQAAKTLVLPISVSGVMWYDWGHVFFVSRRNDAEFRTGRAMRDRSGNQFRYERSIDKIVDNVRFDSESSSYVSVILNSQIQFVVTMCHKRTKDTWFYYSIQGVGIHAIKTTPFCDITLKNGSQWMIDATIEREENQTKDGETKLLRFEGNSIILEYSYFYKETTNIFIPTKHTGKIIVEAPETKKVYLSIDKGIVYLVDFKNKNININSIDDNQIGNIESQIAKIPPSQLKGVQFVTIKNYERNKRNLGNAYYQVEKKRILFSDTPFYFGEFAILGALKDNVCFFYNKYQNQSNGFRPCCFWKVEIETGKPLTFYKPFAYIADATNIVDIYNVWQEEGNIIISFFHGEGKYLTYQINPNDELELISLVATDKNLISYLNDNQIYHNNLDTLLSAYTKGKSDKTFPPVTVPNAKIALAKFNSVIAIKNSLNKTLCWIRLSDNAIVKIKLDSVPIDLNYLYSYSISKKEKVENSFFFSKQHKSIYMQKRINGIEEGYAERLKDIIVETAFVISGNILAVDIKGNVYTLTNKGYFVLSYCEEKRIKELKFSGIISWFKELEKENLLKVTLLGFYVDGVAPKNIGALKIMGLVDELGYQKRNFLNESEISLSQEEIFELPGIQAIADMRKVFASEELNITPRNTKPLRSNIPVWYLHGNIFIPKEATNGHIITLLGLAENRHKVYIFDTTTAKVYIQQAILGSDLTNIFNESTLALNTNSFIPDSELLSHIEFKTISLNPQLIGETTEGLVVLLDTKNKKDILLGVSKYWVNKFTNNENTNIIYKTLCQEWLYEDCIFIENDYPKWYLPMLDTFVSAKNLLNSKDFLYLGKMKNSSSHYIYNSLEKIVYLVTNDLASENMTLLLQKIDDALSISSLNFSQINIPLLENISHLLLIGYIDDILNKISTEKEIWNTYATIVIKDNLITFGYNKDKISSIFSDNDNELSYTYSENNLIIFSARNKRTLIILNEDPQLQFLSTPPATTIAYDSEEISLEVHTSSTMRPKYLWQWTANLNSPWQNWLDSNGKPHCGNKIIYTPSVYQENFYFRIIADIGIEQIVSNNIYLNILGQYSSILKILEQPQDIVVNIDEPFQLKIKAIGYRELRWQASADGFDWYYISSKTIYEKKATATDSRYYRARLVGFMWDEEKNERLVNCSKVFSVTVIGGNNLRPQLKFELTTQPKSTVVKLGEYWELHVEARHYEKVQWQYSLYADKWEDWPRDQSMGRTLTLARHAYPFDSRFYRARFTLDDESYYYSDIVSVTVLDGHPLIGLFKITKQLPQSMQVAYGQVQEIECSAEGYKDYQWEWLPPWQNAWTPWNDEKASKVTVKIGRITNYNVTYKFRVCFTLADDSKYYSNVVNLNYVPLAEIEAIKAKELIIKQQPTNCAVVKNERWSLTVKAENYKYLAWEYSNDGKEWCELTGNLTFGKTPTISRRAFMSDTGYYRVLFICLDNSKAYSAEAYLNVTELN